MIRGAKKDSVELTRTETKTPCLNLVQGMETVLCLQQEVLERPHIQRPWTRLRAMVQNHTDDVHVQEHSLSVLGGFQVEVLLTSSVDFTLREGGPDHATVLRVVWHNPQGGQEVDEGTDVTCVQLREVAMHPISLENLPQHLALVVCPVLETLYPQDVHEQLADCWQESAGVFSISIGWRNRTDITRHVGFGSERLMRTRQAARQQQGLPSDNKFKASVHAKTDMFSDIPVQFCFERHIGIVLLLIARHRCLGAQFCLQLDRQLLKHPVGLADSMDPRGAIVVQSRSHLIDDHHLHVAGLCLHVIAAGDTNL